MGLGAVVLGCAGLNVDGRFLNRDILFAQAGHAQHPRPVDRPGKAGGDAGERTGEQGFVEGAAFCVPVDQGFDQENARAAGEKGGGADKRCAGEQRDGVCPKEGVVHQEHPQAAELVQE